MSGSPHGLGMERQVHRWSDGIEADATPRPLLGLAARHGRQRTSGHRREGMGGARPVREERGDVEDQAVRVAHRHAVGGNLGQQAGQQQPLRHQALDGRRVGRRIEPVRIERHQVDDRIQPAERLGDGARELHDAVGVVVDRPINLDVERMRRHHLGHALHGLALLRELQDETRLVLGEGASHIDAAGTGNPGDEYALTGKVGVCRSRTGSLDHTHQHRFLLGGDAGQALAASPLRIWCRFA